jgi:uncharacterized protein YrzB (UPF0473 family)
MDAMPDDIDIIETTDEEGNVHIFERVEEVEIEGQLYALLLYQGAENEPPREGYDEEVVVMKVGKDPDGTDVFEQIEDEAEFEKVIAHIESLTESEAEDEDEAEDA